MHERYQERLTLDNARESVIYELVEEQALRKTTLRDSILGYYRSFFDDFYSQIDNLVDDRNNISNVVEAKAYFSRGLELLSTEVRQFETNFRERRQEYGFSDDKIIDYYKFSDDLYAAYHLYLEQFVINPDQVVNGFDIEIEEMLLDHTVSAAASSISA